MSLKGFTLIELITTLLIVCGLALVAWPLASSFITKNEVEQRVNTLVNAMHFARNQALIQGVPLVLSGLEASNGWQRGMRLFIDKHETNHYQEGDELLREWRWNKQGAQIVWHGFQSDHYIRFPATLDASSLSGHFLIATREGPIKKVIVNRLGQIRVEDVRQKKHS